MLRLTTKSGSIYHIDLVDNRYQRISHSPQSVFLRAEEGHFERINPLRVGYPCVMVCRPLHPAFASRVIVTTEVTDITHIPDFNPRLPLALADISRNGAGHLPSQAT